MKKSPRSKKSTTGTKRGGLVYLQLSIRNSRDFLRVPNFQCTVAVMTSLAELFNFHNAKVYIPSLLLASACSFGLFRLLRAFYEIVLYHRIINKIPGPKCYPIIGHALEFIQIRVEDQQRYLLKQTTTFKDGLVRLWFGLDANIIICAPKHLEKVFSSNVHISKSDLYQCARNWLGDGLITSTGKKWFRDRKMITPTFHFSILEQFILTIHECSELMMECIEKKMKANPGKSIDVFDSVIRCTLDVLCKTSLGVNIHAQERDVEYAHALHRFAELVNYRQAHPWYRSDWVFKLSAAGREYYKLLNTMQSFTRNVIHERVEWRKLHKSELNDESRVDETGVKRKKALLDHLLDASDDSTTPLTQEEIREQVDTFMFAGHDTTACAIAWTLFCLGNNPEHQEKVHQELDELFGDSRRPFNFKDLTQLKYLDRVMKETLRLYPSVPLIGRHLYEDLQLDEYLLPNGTNLIISPLATHRHPDVWDDPEKFDPDRFLPERIKDKNPYAYIPFSAGPRNCVGQKFAWMEDKIIVASILRNWRVKSALRPEEIEMTVCVILRPVNGLHVYLTPKT